MSGEKKQLTFKLGEKKYTYKGYEDRQELDFFEMFVKMRKESTPEEVEECFRQNFPDSNRERDEIAKMYRREKKKQEEKKAKRERREREKQREEKRKDSSSSGEEHDARKARATPPAVPPLQVPAPATERRVDPVPPASHSHMSKQERDDLHKFIEDVLNEDEGSLNVPPEIYTARPTEPPQTTARGGNFSVKIQMEGSETHKIVSISRQTQHSDLVAAVEKRFGTNLVLSFEDTDGDKVEVDDDDTLEFFIEAIELSDRQGQSKRPKLQCAPKREIRDDAFTTIENPVRAPPAVPAAKTEGGESQRQLARNLRTLTGHGAAVYCCSLRGNLILSASRDRTLRTWDARTGVQRNLFKGHNGFVLSCDISPQESHIVSSSDDYMCRIWNTHTGKKVVSLKGHSDKVYCVQYSPSGQHVVSGSCDRSCRIWTSEGKPVQVLRGHALAVFSCGFSKDGKTVASASDDKMLKLWDWQTTQDCIMTLPGHTGTVWSVGFSPNDNYLVSSSMDHEIKIWDRRKGKEVHSLDGHLTPIHHAIFSTCGKNVISCARDWTVKIWDATTGAVRDTVTGHKNTVYHVAASRDMLVSASLDETVKVWALDL
eukprot:TRINITY_DN1331_c1_g1_i1.p1 TRINITY_DN1331_c1_g1~~TRINITY_DN1331_c1_g1_i1.p1  ORF type:complete len:599 (+),score=171.05 TRINITY_DN1331_c1_g1_i1:124-1920(+)